MRQLTILILTLLASLSVSAQKPVSISPDKKLQTLEGWGVSLCWWANMTGRWDDQKLDEIIDWLVSKEGLNYTHFRYNIGGGDDPENRNCDKHHMARGKGIRAEMPGWKINASSPYDITADSAQIKVMRMIKAKRPDAVFEAFSNSAPWWMTKSGCCAGASDGLEDNLRDDMYEPFAAYLVDVCKLIKDNYGIEFHSLEAFNEPRTNYWKRNDSQEGCHFSLEGQKRLLPILAQKLSASGLSTILSTSDETSVDSAIYDIDNYGDALRLVKQWNVHTYHANLENRAILRDKVKAKNLSLWMSETGDGGRGINGNLRMLQRLFDDMKILQPTVWCDWQYMEEYGDQWSMIGGNFKRGTYHKVKNYSVRQQVTRFIPAGSVFLDVDKRNVLTAITPDNKLIIATINNKRSEENVSFNLSTFKAKATSATCYTTTQEADLSESTLPLTRGTIQQTLPPFSVSTLVISL